VVAFSLVKRRLDAMSRVSRDHGDETGVKAYRKK